MYKSEAIDFANYQVYEVLDDTPHILCVCKEYDVAATIAQTLALLDTSCDTYYLTSVNNPGDFVPGGGWYHSWTKDKETGKLKSGSLE